MCGIPGKPQGHFVGMQVFSSPLIKLGHTWYVGFEGFEGSATNYDGSHEINYTWVPHYFGFWPVCST